MKRFLVFTALWLCSIASAQQILQSGINAQTGTNTQATYIVGELFNTQVTTGSITVSESILQQSAIMASLSVKNEILSNEFSMYPNPAQKVVNVQFLKEQPKKVLLYSVLGKEIPVEINNNQFNVSHLPSGMYVVKFLFSSEKSITKKLIKK